MTDNVVALLRNAEVVFWDFDGVIKESLLVKSLGFEKLFLSYGVDVAERVRRHHEAHGGVSRYDKIPLYLSWAGEAVTSETVQRFCDQFSDLVQQEVINSPWVPGVFEYLQANHTLQRFVLVTATPQQEIQDILQALGISSWFHEVHGAPLSKAVAIQNVLQRWSCSSGQAVMVGDAESDFNAARANDVSFLLRRTPLNEELQRKHSGSSFESL